ncbi:MAG: fumarylacetoacetate hydrolase family protein [Candidatus Omnitrophica bacterium]|nr:fumarylacetoacetate hydrolase family protein [Candidatus Omnitrophota bacterium]
MKLARFVYKGEVLWGSLNEGLITALHSGGPLTKIKPLKSKIPLHKVTLLPPAVPSKIILVGLNYRDHARELEMKLPVEPLIFLKPNTSVIGHKQNINYPLGVKRLDYEAELAVVIAKTARSIRQREVDRYILGFTCLNDVTARCLQKKDGQWTRAKSFDTFCPLGPWLETELDCSNLKIRSYLNGKLKQHSSTANFIFSVRRLIHFISQVMTLLPGDVISTGTPAGVGRMKRGDTVEVEIEGIGRLSNRVA